MSLSFVTSRTEKHFRNYAIQTIIKSQMLSTGHLYFCDFNSYLRRLHIHIYFFFLLWQDVQIDTYIPIVSYNNLHLQALTDSREVHAKCCFSQSILFMIYSLEQRFFTFPGSQTSEFSSTA